MLRLSSYSILSEKLPGGGFALLNGLTGAIEVLSDELGVIIRESLANNDPKAIYVDPEGIEAETVNMLTERGHFTELSHKEERIQLLKVAQILHEEERKRPQFLIVPNMDCNYRCTYCFEKPMQKRLNEIESSTPTLLTREMVDDIYNSIEQIKSEVGLMPGGQIVLYGGEPLDADYKDLISYIIDTGADKGYTFAAITNGHDLDKYIPLLKSNNIKQIQVSFDGPQKIHDSRRISRKDGNSFEVITRNIEKVLAETAEVEIQIRVHVDVETIDYFAELMEVFREKGWLNHNRIVIYASTLYAKNEGIVKPVIKNSDVIKRLKDFSWLYWNFTPGAACTNVQNMLLGSLQSGKPFSLRSVFCAANAGMYIFLPDGNIYGCWESIGKESSKIGTYLKPEGVSFDTEKIIKWFNRSVVHVSGCADCSYCCICAGGCSQYAEYNAGSIYKPFCDDFQEIFPFALARGVEQFLSLIENEQ